MTDKVQKIRKEVERLFNHVKDSNFESDSGAFYYLKDLLDFIDSLQEEPVSIWHDASEKSNKPEEVDNPCKIRKNLQKDIVIVLNGQRHRQVLHKGCFSKKECKEKCSLYERCQRCCIDLCMIFFHDPHCHFVEEPVSDDLEEEIKHFTMSEELYESNSVIKAVANHFSNWQKKQDKETIELAEDHAMLAGIIKGTEHTIGNVRSILNKVAYKNNGLDVNGDYCEQPYVELDDEFRKLLKEE